MLLVENSRGAAASAYSETGRLTSQSLQMEWHMSRTDWYLCVPESQLFVVHRLLLMVTPQRRPIHPGVCV
jgi:hypothetical protein